MSVASATTQVSQKGNAILTNAVIVVIAGGLATTVALPQMLARIPLQNLLKNALLVDRAANAAFFFWITLPWYFKPFVGIITDAFPLFESRRKNYLLVSSLLAVLSWIGLIFTPHEYSKLLWTCLAINIFTMVASTVVGAYMVEADQATSGSGRLNAVRQFVTQAGYIVIGPTAGYLATRALGWTAAAAAASCSCLCLPPCSSFASSAIKFRRANFSTTPASSSLRLAQPRPCGRQPA
jgi:hypothetical protein